MSQELLCTNLWYNITCQPVNQSIFCEISEENIKMSYTYVFLNIKQLVYGR